MSGMTGGFPQSAEREAEQQLDSIKIQEAVG
jgi:hypothetical protein